MVADQVHDGHMSHVGNVGIVRQARRKQGARGTHQNGGCRGSRFEAGPKKQRNQSRTHNGADTGSRGNSDVDRKGEQRSDRNHQNTDVADRTGQVMH